MSLASMTGFARSEGDCGAFRWTWELRSVNGKGLDLRLRLPQGRERLEPEARKRLSAVLTRGNVAASLSIQRTHADAKLEINQSALDAALEAVEVLAATGRYERPRPEGVLALRGVLEPVEANETDEESSELDAAVLGGLDAAAAGLVAARRREGGALGDVLGGQVETIAGLAAAARACPATSPEAIAERLRQQIDQLMGTEREFDPQRLHQEAALLATKADIREEIDRLDAHTSAARELLEAGGPVGRRLDFLAQEFNREANTICSKSNDVELTKIGLELKVVIDRMREQIQNLE